MAYNTQFMNVYGFTIEVHAGGRRVWPPSFKRFIKDKLDQGALTVEDVIATCNVSKSLVYKWRSDVAKSLKRYGDTANSPMFTEIVVDKECAMPCTPENCSEDRIILQGRASQIVLPVDYSVTDLVKILLALEGQPE